MVFASNLAQLAPYHLKECCLSAIRSRVSHFAGNQHLLFEVIWGFWRYTNPKNPHNSGGAELARKDLQPQNYHLNSPKTTRQNAAFMTDPKKLRKKWRFLGYFGWLQNCGKKSRRSGWWYSHHQHRLIVCLNVTCCIEDVKASQIRSHDQMITSKSCGFWVAEPPASRNHLLGNAKMTSWGLDTTSVWSLSPLSMTEKL